MLVGIESFCDSWNCLNCFGHFPCYPFTSKLWSINSVFYSFTFWCWYSSVDYQIITLYEYWILLVHFFYYSVEGKMYVFNFSHHSLWLINTQLGLLQFEILLMFYLFAGRRWQWSGPTLAEEESWSQTTVEAASWTWADFSSISCLSSCFRVWKWTNIWCCLFVFYERTD